MGVAPSVGPMTLERLEHFFIERGVDVCPEVCPLAGVRLYRAPRVSHRVHACEVAARWRRSEPVAYGI
jgi:hypothetical protein